MDAEVSPRINELENKDWKLARALVKQAAELGLVGANIPEEYGGLGLGQTSGAIIAENIGRAPAFSTPPGGPSGIGLLPQLYFGAQSSTQKYLPPTGAWALMPASVLSEAG